MIILLLLLLSGITVSAATEQEEKDRLFTLQSETLGTNRLFDALPQQTKEALQKAGIGELKAEGLYDLQMGAVLSTMMEMLTSNSKTPLCGLTVCLGIILLCSVTEGFRIGSSDLRLGSVQNAVGTMCICTAVIVPFSHTIASAAEVISGGAGFMLLYVPIMAGLMASTGHEVTAGSYYTGMMTAGNLVSVLSAKLLVPMMNVFLALSVTSSVSPKMNLSALSETVYKVAKWVLTFVMSVFITVMSLNTMITSSMDQVSKRALKFTVSSFVPVVGGVLSEALNTFSGSLELLKTGAGVLVIIGSAFWLLPVLAECIIWQFSLFLLGAVSDICGITQMSGLFRAVSKTAGILTALLLCVMTVFVIGTVMILLLARQ